MAYVALVYGGFSGEAEVSKKSANEIFNASDLMVDALTKLLDRERKKKKNN